MPELLDVNTDFIEELIIVLGDCRERLSGVGTTRLQYCINKLQDINKKKEKNEKRMDKE